MVTADDMELVGKLAVKGPEDYRKKVKAFLVKIKSTKVGNLLIENAVSRKIFITPDPDAEMCNGSVPTHPTPSGKCGSITTSAVINFSPGCTDPSWPDENTLVHELVHAVRKTQGRRDCKPLPKGLRRFEDREEFYAILLTNIYTSEKRNTSLKSLTPFLRNDHRSGRMQGRAAEAFLEHEGALELVEAFMRDMPELSKGIAKVNTAFNPIRDVHQYALACVAGF